MLQRRKQPGKKALESFEEAIRQRALAQEEEEDKSKPETYVIEYLPEPVWVPPQRLHPSVKHNCFCEVCSKIEPVSYGKSVLKCTYCNVIAHVKCLKKKQRNFDPNAHKRHWTCYYCVDALDNSKDTYNHAVFVAAKFRQRTQAQIMIAKYFRRYSARKHYVAVYTVIIMLQIQFRVRRRKLQFFMQRQSKIRAIKLSIDCCINLFPADRLASILAASNGAGGGGSGSGSPSKKRDAYFYIIVTVLEMLPYGVKQNWKFYTDNVYSSQTKRSLQHVTFDCEILLPGVSGFNTVCLTVFQKGNSRDMFLGQAHVFLGENHAWKRGGHFELPLGDQTYAIQDHIGLELKSEYRFPPVGTIKFGLHPSFKMHTECGSVFGTSIEEMLRILNMMPSFDGYVQPATNTNVLSKRKGIISTVSSDQTTVPLKRMWMVLMEGVGYVYPHFGGPLKLVITMDHFQPHTTIKDKNIIFILKHNAYPEFRFTAGASEDLLRWKCAFICCSQQRRFCKEKFEMRNLIEEILKMNVEHAKRAHRRQVAPVYNLPHGNFTMVNKDVVPLVPLVHVNGQSTMASVANSTENTIHTSLLSRMKGLALRAKEEVQGKGREVLPDDEDEFEINYSYKVKPGATPAASKEERPSHVLGTSALRMQILKQSLSEQPLKVSLPSPTKRPAPLVSEPSFGSRSGAPSPSPAPSTGSTLSRDSSFAGFVDVLAEVARKEHTRELLGEEIKEEYEVDDAIINENVMNIGMALTQQMLLKGAKKKLKRKKNKKHRVKSVLYQSLAPR